MPHYLGSSEVGWIHGLRQQPIKHLRVPFKVWVGFLHVSCGSDVARTNKNTYLLFRLPHAGEFGRKSLQSPCAVLAHRVWVVLAKEAELGNEEGTKHGS